MVDGGHHKYTHLVFRIMFRLIDYYFYEFPQPMVLVNCFSMGENTSIILVGWQSTVRRGVSHLIDWFTVWAQSLHCYTLWPLYGLWIQCWSFWKQSFIMRSHITNNNKKKPEKDWNHREEWTEDEIKEEKKWSRELKTENRQELCVLSAAVIITLDNDIMISHIFTFQ